MFQGQRIESSLPDPKKQVCVHGRVKWKLRFQWTPGGEDLLPDGKNLTVPWWAPTYIQPGDMEATPYMRRKDLLRYCHSLLPLYLFAGPGPYFGNSLPRGWYCVYCGKLNKQIFFRHRKCVCHQVIVLLSPHRSCYEQCLYSRRVILLDMLKGWHTVGIFLNISFCVSPATQSRERSIRGNMCGQMACVPFVIPLAVR